VAPGEDGERFGVIGLRGREVPGVLALEDLRRRAQPLGDQAVAVQPAEAERALGDPRARHLHGMPDRAAQRAQVLAPVGL
jgi:hypothetical protein